MGVKIDAYNEKWKAQIDTNLAKADLGIAKYEELLNTAKESKVDISANSDFATLGDLVSAMFNSEEGLYSRDLYDNVYKSGVDFGSGVVTREGVRSILEGPDKKLISKLKRESKHPRTRAFLTRITGNAPTFLNLLLAQLRSKAGFNDTKIKSLLNMFKGDPSDNDTLLNSLTPEQEKDADRPRGLINTIEVSEALDEINEETPAAVETSNVPDDTSSSINDEPIEEENNSVNSDESINDSTVENTDVKGNIENVNEENPELESEVDVQSVNPDVESEVDTPVEIDVPVETEIKVSNPELETETNIPTEADVMTEADVPVKTNDISNINNESTEVDINNSETSNTINNSEEVNNSFSESNCSSTINNVSERYSNEETGVTNLASNTETNSINNPTLEKSKESSISNDLGISEEEMVFNPLAGLKAAMEKVKEDQAAQNSINDISSKSDVNTTSTNKSDVTTINSQNNTLEKEVTSESLTSEKITDNIDVERSILGIDPDIAPINNKINETVDNTETTNVSSMSSDVSNNSSAESTSSSSTNKNDNNNTENITNNQNNQNGGSQSVNIDMTEVVSRLRKIENQLAGPLDVRIVD